MSHERLMSYEDSQSLAPLLGKTSLLKRRGGRILCEDKFDIPLDEFGIPRRVQLMRQVLGTMEKYHYWTGYTDVHHTAWPGSEYRRVISDEQELIGSAYRGAGSLKVRLPRQLHNYVHAITVPPPMPTFDVMRQYALEHSQVSRLYDTIKVTSYDDFPNLASLPYEEQERLRAVAYQQKLERMQEGQLGLMPEREYLAGLEIAAARPVLRSIARVQGLTNARRSKRQFFAHEPVAA